MIGRALILIGLVLVVAGGLIFLIERAVGERGWRLPGDIVWRGDGWRIYAPLGTALLVSLILTILLNLLVWLIRR